MLIVEILDNVSAAAFSMAVAASGAVRLFRTTPLLTLAEGVHAMQKLPSFLPGHETGSDHHHIKHGFAAAILVARGIHVRLVQTGTRRLV